MAQYRAQPVPTNAPPMVQPEHRDRAPDMPVIEVKSPIRALAFTTDMHLVSGDKESVRVWRWSRSTRQWQQTSWAEAKDVRCIAVSCDGRWIAAGKSWGETTVWDRTKTTLNPGEEVPMLDKPTFTDNDGHTVTSVDFSPTEPNRLVIATGGRMASIWDVATGKRVVGPLEHPYWVVAAKFSPGGDRIATATYNRDSVRVYDSNSNSNSPTPITEFSASVPAYYNTGLLWSGDFIFVWSKNTVKNDKSTGTTYTIKQFRYSSTPRFQKLAPEKEWQVDESNYPCIASPRSGEFIIYSVMDGVKILRTSTSSQGETLFEPSQDVLSMTISPDGRLLATGDVRDGIGTISFRSLNFERP